MHSQNWYCSRRGRIEGPFTEHQVKSKVDHYDDLMVSTSPFAQWKNGRVVFNRLNDISLKTRQIDSMTDKHRPTNVSSVNDITSKTPKSSNDLQRAAAAKNMKRFAERWLKMELRYSSEKQALLAEFINNGELTPSQAKKVIEKVKDKQRKFQKLGEIQETGDQVAEKMMNGIVQSDNDQSYHSYDSNDSKNESELGQSSNKPNRSQLINLEEKLKEIDALTQNFKSDAQEQKPKLAAVSPIHTMNHSTYTFRRMTVSEELDESEQMMRRMARRRRRRR